MWKLVGVLKPEADASAAAARARLGGIVEGAGSAFVKCREWSGLVVRRQEGWIAFVVAAAAAAAEAGSFVEGILDSVSFVAQRR